MSILISGVGLPFPFSEEEALAAARKKLSLSSGAVRSGRVHKQSLDLRRGELKAVCTVELELCGDERAFAERCREPAVRLRSAPVLPVPTGEKRLSAPPVVVGFGPAGMFAALILAKNGYCPVVLERGSEMSRRDAAVDRYFSGGPLTPDCNIQFGEGGAGAYSDGKLTCRIGDPRCELVLSLLQEHGAPAEVMRLAKPHIGTDLLKQVVVSIRREICALGGQVRFDTPARGLLLRENTLRGLLLPGEELPCETAVLALGHSARDTFLTLRRQGIVLQPKPFSVGVRAEHLQQDIDLALYGSRAGTPGLPPGEYALSRREGERGCYSFCMCPGGQVVAAASEPDTVVTNGMSYHARNGKNANAALCVSVGPEDYGSGPLDGVAFQRRLEQAAFALAGDGTAPVQRVDDFLAGRVSRRLGRVEPTYPRGWSFRPLDGALPPFVCELLRRSLPAFGKRLRGYDSPDAILTGVETRTSSPVRILRGEDLYSPSARGLIPCGEGAGYAGGIVSAAVDGIRAAERIFGEYRPLRA